MKIHLISDIHLEFAKMRHAAPEGTDVVVIAGDGGSGKIGLKWAAETFRGLPIIYVAGNHEFYGREFRSHQKEMREFSAENGIHFLERDTVKIEDVVFVGTTLWTDYNLYGEVHASMEDAVAGMSDYQRIACNNSGALVYTKVNSLFTEVITPFVLLEEHAMCLEFVKDNLVAYSKEKVVVVTHHAPSPQSILGKYEGDFTNPCYASDLEYIMNSDHSPFYWFHGHIHGSSNYDVGRTTVVSNPRGYPLSALKGTRNSHVFENPKFDPKLLLTI